MFKLVLEKAEEPEIKLPTSAGSSKKAREFQKNIYFGFIDYTKASDCVDHNKLWKILKEMGIPDRPPDLPPEKSVCRSGSNSWNWTGSKSGKEYVKAKYCHPAYLTYMQSTSCEMLGWMMHKLESRLPGEIPIISDTQMTLPLWQKTKN